MAAVEINAFNSAPKFDDFFESLSRRLEQAFGLSLLIVTASCPNFLKSPTPSVLYSFNSLKPLESYFACIDTIDVDESLTQINATVFGLDSSSYSIKLYLKTKDPIPEVEAHKISNECNQVLSDSLKAKVLNLRDYVVAMSLQTTDISSFFHKATTEGLRAFFSFDGASAFYHDYHTDALVLAATTGVSLLKAGGLRRADIKYHSASKSWVRKSFESGDVISEWAQGDEPLKANTHGESVSNIRNRLFLPIDVRDGLKSRLSETYGGQAKANGRVGALRLVNTRRNGLLNPISKIDMHVLEHFCEYLAVLGTRYLRVLSVIHDQEKSTHGFVTDLSTLRLRVQLLRQQINSVLYQKGDARTEYPQLIVDIEGYLNLFERDFFAVQDGMAFQLQTVAEFSDGVIGAAGREQPFCTKPFVEVVMRILQSKEYISRNYGRKEARISFHGEKRFSKEFTQMPSLLVPQRTFYLALRNLVENSIKYTPRGQVPSLDFRWMKRRETLHFEVSDQGIGINESDEPSLFREGFRARNALREATRGNGLGLCVSRRGIQSYGGDLKYLGKGRTGTGSLFAIEMPVKRFGRSS